jgi:hypothetical protein
MIEIKFDLSSWIDLLEKVRAEAPAAISRALNRSGDMVATVVVRTLADETGLAVQEVRDELDTSHSTPADLEYTITIPGRYLTLAHFDPHELKRGGVSARPWAHRRTFPHAFMVRDVPFIREGAQRFPIRPLFGPSLAVEVERGNTVEAARAKFMEVMPRRLAYELARVLPTKGGEGGDDID